MWNFKILPLCNPIRKLLYSFRSCVGVLDINCWVFVFKLWIWWSNKKLFNHVHDVVFSCSRCNKLTSAAVRALVEHCPTLRTLRCGYPSPLHPFLSCWTSSFEDGVCDIMSLVFLQLGCKCFLTLCFGWIAFSWVFQMYIGIVDYILCFITLFPSSDPACFC